MSDAYFFFNLHLIKESEKKIDELRNKKKSNKL
jgi:hypothetical protein